MALMRRPRYPLWLLLEAMAWLALFAGIFGSLWRAEWQGLG
jgi:hypothetical protein